AQRQVDAAFLWGPEAGYENKTRYGNVWRVTPLAGAGMEGEVAVGVKKGNDALVASLDKALVDLRPEIVKLADKYGFPNAAPVRLEDAALATPVRLAAIEPTKVAAADAAVTDPVSAGKALFDSHCAHCHAPNAASPIRERDLRRLKLRYGDKWREVAAATIKNGRPDVGMPIWKDTIDDERIGFLLSYFEALQREP
ncbi:MAG: c-type cytochrome, partial [Pseudonocardiaceae bacterium]